MSLKYDGINIPRAKELRKNATPEENHLWYDFLKMYPIRFQRQKAIDHFIADFYCHAAKLVIELDGSQHFEDGHQLRDIKRDEYLMKLGIRVLRYTNLEIQKNFQGVCLDIVNHLDTSSVTS